MLSGDFWDRRFCRISTIPANALSGALIGAVKLHSRLYLLASITLSKTGTFFPSVTLSVIIHCSSLTIGGPGLRWAIKQVAFPPTASHFNAFQNTHVRTLNARTHAQPLHCSVRCGRSLARDWGSAFRASSWSLDSWPNICNIRTAQAGAARSLCPTQELSGAPTSALAKAERTAIEPQCCHCNKAERFAGVSVRSSDAAGDHTIAHFEHGVCVCCCYSSVWMTPGVDVVVMEGL